MKNLKIFTENIEQEAIDQINTLMEQPAFSDCKVRIMPDVHAGAGCVIGFTADLGDKVIPNIVGVDIGCGMLTIELGELDAEDDSIVNNVTEVDFAKLDEVIRKRVPSGYNIHEASSIYRPHEKFEKLLELKCYRNLKDTRRFQRSLGTLGGGNHFIEIDEGYEGRKFLVIHTGSRNLGKQVADYYQNLAVEIMQGKDELYSKQEQLIADYKAQGRRTEIQAAIKELHKTWKPNELDIPKDLCYLTGQYRDDYLHDMTICQEFAKLNRWYIALAITAAMGWVMIDHFETIHNYIEFETNMVRKGAISAKKNEKLLIPINMRDGCIVGLGKGNEDWNCSAPHGAGRIMSRRKARETVSLDTFREAMDGIYTTSVCVDTVDEAPMVYKAMDEIVDNIRDTVDILEIIKPVYNFKAGGD
jgi:RNA-splicing ligase RtcB